MTEKRRAGTMVYFDFSCPGCEAEGELGIDTNEGMRMFMCPAECGSAFVPWQPTGTTWSLKCVVQRFEAAR